MWLKAPVAEPASGGGWRYSVGKRATLGTPQGGVISPLLAKGPGVSEAQRVAQRVRGADEEGRPAFHQDDAR